MLRVHYRDGGSPLSIINAKYLVRRLTGPLWPWRAQHSGVAAVHNWPSPAAAVRELFTNPGFILLVLYFTLPALAGWVVRDWMPEILREKFSLGQGKAGVSAILFVQIASIVGVLIEIGRAHV